MSFRMFNLLFVLIIVLGIGQAAFFISQCGFWNTLFAGDHIWWVWYSGMCH